MPSGSRELTQNGAFSTPSPLKKHFLGGNENKLAKRHMNSILEGLSLQVCHNHSLSLLRESGQGRSKTLLPSSVIYYFLQRKALFLPRRGTWGLAFTSGEKRHFFFFLYIPISVMCPLSKTARSRIRSPRSPDWLRNTRKQESCTGPFPEVSQLPLDTAGHGHGTPPPYSPLDTEPGVLAASLPPTSLVWTGELEPTAKAPSPAMLGGISGKPAVLVLGRACLPSLPRPCPCCCWRTVLGNQKPYPSPGPGSTTFHNDGPVSLPQFTRPCLPGLWPALTLHLPISLLKWGVWGADSRCIQMQCLPG